MNTDDTILISTNKDMERLEIDIAINMAQEYCVPNDFVFNKSIKQLCLGRHKFHVSELPDWEPLTPSNTFPLS